MPNPIVFAWGFDIYFTLIQPFYLITTDHDVGLGHCELVILLWALKLEISHLFFLVHTYLTAIMMSSVKSLTLLKAELKVSLFFGIVHSHPSWK